MLGELGHELAVGGRSGQDPADVKGVDLAILRHEINARFSRFSRVSTHHEVELHAGTAAAGGNVAAATHELLGLHSAGVPVRPAL
jgi:hypothetical protein